MEPDALRAGLGAVAAAELGTAAWAAWAMLAASGQGAVAAAELGRAPGCLRSLARLLTELSELSELSEFSELGACEG